MSLKQEILEYIRRMEECVDGEWGRCRDFDKLLRDGEAPELYYRVLKELSDDKI